MNSIQEKAMAERSCALLLHSSDRREARAFWRPLLQSVDRHFPPDLCTLVFSYDFDEAAARAAVRRLSQPFRLLRRGRRSDWAPSLIDDLDRLEHRWIFHLMDDAIVPDPLSRHSLSAVLDAAVSHNASTVSLYRRSFGFWSANGRAQLSRALSLTVYSAPGIGLLQRTQLDFFSPSFERSMMVLNQNFALWQRTELRRALSMVPSSLSPAGWELSFDPPHKGRRRSFDIQRALVVKYVNGTDGMEGIEDTAHNGSLKAGWSACAWMRAASRLGLPYDALPGGAHFARQPGYSFCSIDGAIGDGALLLHATPQRCGCGRSNKRDKASVTCDCGVRLVSG